MKDLKMEKGLCCKKCSYAAPILSSMKSHWSKDHREQAYHIFVAEHWWEGWVQHFFVVPMWYFLVEPSSAKHSSIKKEDFFMIFLKIVAPTIEKESIQVLPDMIQPWEIFLLVKIMRWCLYLVEYITNC